MHVLGLLGNYSMLAFQSICTVIRNVPEIAVIFLLRIRPLLTTSPRLEWERR